MRPPAHLYVCACELQARVVLVRRAPGLELRTPTVIQAPMARPCGLQVTQAPMPPGYPRMARGAHMVPGYPDEAAGPRRKCRLYIRWLQGGLVASTMASTHLLT